MVKDASRDEEAKMADQTENSSMSVTSMSASTSPSVDDMSSTGSAVSSSGSAVSSTGSAASIQPTVPATCTNTVLVNTYEVVPNGSMTTIDSSSGACVGMGGMTAIDSSSGACVGMGGMTAIDSSSGACVGMGGGASGVEVAMTNGLVLDSASTPGAASSPPTGATFITQAPLVAGHVTQSHPAITMTPVYSINTDGMATMSSTGNAVPNTLTCPANQNHRGPSPNRYSPNGTTSNGGATNGQSGGDSPSGQTPGGQAQQPGQAQHQAAQQQQHVVHVHVSPGETFSVRIEDQIQHIQGKSVMQCITLHNPHLCKFQALYTYMYIKCSYWASAEIFFRQSFC